MKELVIRLAVSGLIIWLATTPDQDFAVMRRWYHWSYQQWWDIAAYAQRKAVSHYNKYQSEVMM